MHKSIMSNEKQCYVCGSTNELHIHHIFEGTANRKKSDEDGCWVYLCGKHHNLSNEGIHFNKELDLSVKRVCQDLWQETYNKDIIDFIKRYGRNYL